jgi:hypothetical protein
MPNYVYGSLYVTGDKKKLLEFKKFAEHEEEYIDDDNDMTLKKRTNILDMNQFIPYPQKFKDIDKKNKEYFDKLREIKMKVENQEKLTAEEKKTANKLILIELEAGNLPYRKDGYNRGGYEWCCRNWGTKWNFCEVDLDEEDEQLNYNFSTAWSIPMPVLLKMSKMFPALTFEYNGNEESEEFEVEYEFKKGKLTIKDEKIWEEIQIEKIQEGNIDGFDYDMELYNELEKHKGHDIIYVNEDKDKIREFRCKTCDNKTIWNCNK